MVTCAVPNCNSCRKDNPQNYSFHKFPQNDDVRKKWLMMINRKDWIPRKNTTICSKHFEQNCFFGRSCKIVKLRFGSVPTLFMPQTKHQHQKNYKSYLTEAFGLEAKCAEPPPLWPCKPREKSYLSTADSILDLPNYSIAPFPELLDWSSSNMLVAALGVNYHMFSWNAQKVTGRGWTRFTIQCCKFDPRGELLAMGTHIGLIELHSNRNMCLVTSRCACDATEGSICSITAITWSPTGNSFITGCSRGIVSTYDRSARRVHSWRGGTRDPVLTIRVSTDARYVALVTVNSPLVVVLTWPSLEYHLTLDVHGTVKSISWHPWRSALLGVGAVFDQKSTIVLWDPPTAKFKQCFFQQDEQCEVDVLLFSHRTGELVLGIWSRGDMTTFPRPKSELVVMGDPYTVVDRSSKRRDLDRVRTMVFSPCGTMLATATVDEDLIIWNFLPEDPKKGHGNKSRRFSALPVYLDQVTHGFVLR